MIGYAPFLGQVRLTPLSHLGQQEPAISAFVFLKEGPTVSDHSVDVTFRAPGESDGRTLHFNLREMTELEIRLPSRTEYVKITPGAIEGWEWAPRTIERPMADGNQFVFSAVRDKAHSEAPSIPTWAWMLGALAAAGGVIYFSTRP